MKYRVLYLFICIVFTLAFLASPLTATAEGDEQQELPASSILITEIQTGAGVTGQAGTEFIELSNTTDEAIDLTGWQLRFVSATASTVTIDNPSFKVDVAPEVIVGETKKLEPGEHYILRTETMVAAGQIYTGNLTANGSLILFGPSDPLTCERTVIDALAWKSGSLGDGSAVPIPDTKDRLLVRFIDEEGKYVHMRDNLHDFGAFSPNPTGLQTVGVKNTQLLPLSQPSTVNPILTTDTKITEQDCTIPDPNPPVDPPDEESPPSVTEPGESDDEPTIPAGNIGLKAPQLSEFLPNPASPQTDANDEFVELYNPNNISFDLTGYILEVGLKTKKKYTFPAGTLLQPKAFIAFFSNETNLSLSNTGSIVRLVDPLGNVLAESDQYVNAKDGQAWILANGSWQWTTKPTPNAINHMKPPEAKKKSSSKTKSSAINSASTSKKNSSNEGEEQQVVAATTTNPGSPLHPGVLAAIGVFALLYGAYEYRHDLANKIRIFRTNRAARSALRQSAKGR